jgi:RimJ/RimL family protein N-acetyltransferase
LTDGVVVLREPRDDDAPALVAFGRDPDILRWTEVPEGYDLDRARAYVARATAERRAGTTVTFLVEDAVTGALLGNSDIRRLSPTVAELGYLLLPEARGRGVMTRAVRLLTAHALDELGVERVQALAHPGNRPSAAVLERAGFAFEGVRREHRGPGEDRLMFAVVRP